MGMDLLKELVTDRRTPFQKFRDRAVMTVIILIILGLLVAGCIQVYHWIAPAVH